MKKEILEFEVKKLEKDSLPTGRVLTFKIVDRKVRNSAVGHVQMAYEIGNEVYLCNDGHTYTECTHFSICPGKIKGINNPETQKEKQLKIEAINNILRRMGYGLRNEKENILVRYYRNGNIYVNHKRINGKLILKFSHKDKHIEVAVHETESSLIVAIKRMECILADLDSIPQHPHETQKDSQITKEQAFKLLINIGYVKQNTNKESFIKESGNRIISVKYEEVFDAGFVNEYLICERIPHKKIILSITGKSVSEFTKDATTMDATMTA